jgi:Flp pilus assembly pilin Flp
VAVPLHGRPPLLHAFIRSRSGATAIEYALIAAMLAVFIIGALRGAGDSLMGTMEYIAAATQRASGSGDT